MCFRLNNKKVSTSGGLDFACNIVQHEAMSSENIPRFTRSQAARVNRNMEDDVAPEDSISQAGVRTSSRVSSSHSSHSRSARSKEQLELDISTLAIKVQSQQRRARLVKEKLDVEKKKLDIELELEKNNLQEEMDLATNEKESLETSEQNKGTLEKEVQKMLDDCCTYLGSGRVDLNGKKACRVYMRPDKNKIEPEKTITRHTPALKVPHTSTVKKETKPISVFPQNDEAEPRIVTATRRLPETPLVTRRLPEIPTKESSIGYFPSPRPEHSDKALEALYSPLSIPIKNPAV